MTQPPWHSASYFRSLNNAACIAQTTFFNFLTVAQSAPQINCQQLNGWRCKAHREINGFTQSYYLSKSRYDKRDAWRVTLYNNRDKRLLSNTVSRFEAVSFQSLHMFKGRARLYATRISWELWTEHSKKPEYNTSINPVAHITCPTWYSVGERRKAETYYITYQSVSCHRSNVGM